MGAVVAFLMPWILAEGIAHPRRSWILALVLGLGWTGVGWIGACAWVARDWPRAPRRPKLSLVDPAFGLTRPRFVRRRWMAAIALGASALLGFVALAFSPTPETPAPEWNQAKLGVAEARVHMGPNLRWPAIGRLRAPCRLDVVDRKGGWRRVWRRDDCGGGLAARSGWVRRDHLRDGS